MYRMSLSFILIMLLPSPCTDVTALTKLLMNFRFDQKAHPNSKNR